MGMTEFAIETVQGLYDDQGGQIPADLHLPTEVDLKTAAKLGAASLRVGTAVQVTPASGRVGFEVAGMDRTRHQTGIVVSVDTGKGLALVETYLEHEGELVRWWYPCSVLQFADGKEGRTSVKTSTGVSTPEEDHSNLLLCESKLTRLYSRTAVLHLARVAGLLGTLVTPRQVLGLLTVEQLRPAAPACCFVESATAEVFFNWSRGSRDRYTGVLQHWLDAAVGEGKVAAFVQDLCGSFFQENPALPFLTVPIPVETGRECHSLSFPKACAVTLAVTPKDVSKGAKTLYTTQGKIAPWCRVYLTGAARGAQHATYPNVQGTATNFPYYLVISPRVYIRTSVKDATPNAVVVAQAIPEDFPLVLTFLQEVLTRDARVPRPVLCTLVEACLRLLSRVNLTPLLQEFLHHTLALLLRAAGPLSAPTLVSAIYDLQKELLALYKTAIDNTCVNWKTCRHSTYTQTLLELLLAHWEMNAPIPPPLPLPLPVCTSVPLPLTTAPLGFPKGKAGVPGSPKAIGREPLSKPPNTPSSPNPPVGRRGKLPATPGVTRPREVGKAGKDVSKKGAEKVPSTVTPLSSALTPVLEVDDTPVWLRNTQQVDGALRSLLGWQCGRHTPPGANPAQREPPLVSRAPEDLVIRGWLSMLQPTFMSRLVGIQLLPRTVPAIDLASLLTSLANKFGGLYKDQVFVVADPVTGDPTGDAILELRVPAAVPFFLKALANVPALIKDGQPTSFAVTLDPVPVKAVATPLNLPIPFPFAKMKPAASTAPAVVPPPAETGTESDLCHPPPEVIHLYLQQKMLTKDGSELTPPVRHAILALFLCADPDQALHAKVCKDTVLQSTLVEAGQTVPTTPPALVRTFLAVTECGETPDGIARVFTVYGDGTELAASGLLAYTWARCSSSPRLVLAALLSLGFDFHLDRYRPFCLADARVAMGSPAWPIGADLQIVEHANQLVRGLHVPWDQLGPGDFFIQDAEMTQGRCVHLQSLSCEMVRLRYALLLELNRSTASVLPLIDLRGTALHGSMKHVLLNARGFLFYGMKMDWCTAVLNETVHRIDKKDGPVITLDPLETVGTRAAMASNSQFVQAAHQLETVDSALLRVPVATGGDPTFPLNIKFLGDAVAGSSGSFRDFLSRMVKELQSGVLPIFIECPAAALGHNRGKFVLRPGPASLPVIKMLEFFGVLVGISLRADVPLSLDLLPCFWKSLVGACLDESDLLSVDLMTATQLKKIEDMLEEEFDGFVEQHGLSFIFRSLDGREVGLRRIDDPAWNASLTWFRIIHIDITYY